MMIFFIVVVIVAVGVFVACTCKAEMELLTHRKQAHDMKMRQQEVATRWREREMAKDDLRGKHASKE